MSLNPFKGRFQANFSPKPRPGSTETSDSVNPVFEATQEPIDGLENQTVPLVFQSFNLRQATNSEYYNALNARGIGSKPLVLLVNELIPVKSSVSNQDVSDYVNLNFGEITNIKTTNIVRLIELQNILNKQINILASKIIIENATKEKLNLSNEEFEAIKKNISDFYKSLKVEISSNFFDYFTRENSKNLVNIQLVNSLIEKEIVTRDFIDILDSDFVYALSNLAINSAYIEKYKKFVYTLVVLKNDFYDAINMLKYKTGLNQNALRAYAGTFTEIKNTFENAVPNEKNSQYLFLDNYFNLRNTNKSNLSLYLNLINRLTCHSLMFDSINSNDAYTEPDKLSLEYEKVKISSSGDLREAMNVLRQIKIPNLINAENKVSSNQRFQKLNGSKIQEILSKVEGNSRAEKLAELVAAVCFDQVSGINTKIKKSMFTNISNNNTSQNILSFIANNLIDANYNLPAERITADYLNLLEENTGQNLRFFKKMFSKESKENMSTIPFEFKDSLLLEFYDENITNDSYSYHVLKDFQENKNFNDLRSKISKHKRDIMKILNAFIRSFSLGFDDKGDNLNSSLNYTLGNLNPQSFFNFYVQAFADDISTTAEDVEAIYPDSADVQEVITQLSEDITAFIPRSDLYRMILHGFASNSNEGCVYSFLCSILSTLANGRTGSTFLFGEDQDYLNFFKDNPVTSSETTIMQTIRNDIQGLLANECNYNYVQLFASFLNEVYGPLPDGSNGFQVYDRFERNQNQKFENLRFGNGEDWNSNIMDSTKGKGNVSLTNAAFGVKVANVITSFKRRNFKEFHNANFLGRIGLDGSPTTGNVDRNENYEKEINIVPENNYYSIDELAYAEPEEKFGVQFFSKGQLGPALIFNRGLLYKSSYENENYSFPNINSNSLPSENLNNVLKKGYFEPDGEYGSGKPLFKCTESHVAPSEGPFNTTNIHLYLVFHLFFLEVINKSIPISYVAAPGDDSMQIRYSPDSFVGLKDALSNKSQASNASDEYKSAFNSAKQIIDLAKNKIKKRNDNILKTLYAFYHQVEKLDYLMDQIDNAKNNLGNFILQDIGNVDIDLVPYSDIAALNHIVNQFNSKFIISEKYFPFAESNILSPNDIDLKIMIKVLSQSGYGLLKNEKIGNKNIFHVGISQILIDKLYQSSSIMSNLICIVVERKNQINMTEKTIPKYFVFDMSKYISPFYYDNQTKITSNHIENYADNTTFSQTLNEIEILELKNPFFNSLGTGKNAFVSNGILGNIVNNYSSDQIETITSELQINHVMDYYLKLYTKTTIEMDLKETNFTLYPNAFEENTIDSDQKIINFYDKVNNDVLNTLETVIDPSENFQKQLKRTKKILRTSPLFNSNARAENAFLNTGCFNRVFSFLINDEDFIVLGENEENTDQTQYSLGPKLSIDPNQTQRDASIYSFNFKVALLKRW